MSKILVTEIIKIISGVPGLVALANADVHKTATPLSVDKMENGIILNSEDGSYSISLGIFVENGVRTKVIVKSLTSAIKNIFDIKQQKIEKINIYVRGVR